MSQELKKIIVHTAIYYGRDLKPEVLSMMCEDLADLDPAACIAAYTAYRRNPKNKTFPLPAQIREIVRPEDYISPEIMAREIAARIVGAVTSCGWCNPKAAESEIGPEGWELVKRQGGWMHICQNLGVNINPTTFQAQLRDQLVGSLTYGSRNIEQKILSPSKNETRELQSAGDILKTLSGGFEPEPEDAA